MTEIIQLMNFITLKENKYYHKPEYTKCKFKFWFICRDPECNGPIIKHPLVDILPSVPNYYRIVSAPVIHNSNTLSHASTELQDNEAIVIDAVHQ